VEVKNLQRRSPDATQEPEGWNDLEFRANTNSGRRQKLVRTHRPAWRCRRLTHHPPTLAANTSQAKIHFVLAATTSYRSSPHVGLGGSTM
jgi:hypothetical protein